MSDALKAELAARAREMGFARMGVAQVRALRDDAQRLSEWIGKGYHGSMGYLQETLEVRRDPRQERMLPSARSAVVLAMSYACEDGELGPWPARLASYARGRDYHNVLYKRARRLVKFLKRQGVAARCTVDSMPSMERAWARLAGVGFVGKNCCLIVPGLGSRVFLALVLTSAELEPDPPLEQGCGACTLCLQHCPTGALVQERLLDARLCVSYLTGVHQGAIDEALMPRMGDWIYGCDACQDPCPHNSDMLDSAGHSPATERVGRDTEADTPHQAFDGDLEAADPFCLQPRWRGVDAEELLRMGDERFALFAQGLVIRKSGREGMARNAAIVLGNVGRREHLGTLKQVARDDPSPVVRHAARWAVRRIENRDRWV